MAFQALASLFSKLGAGAAKGAGAAAKGSSGASAASGASSAGSASGGFGGMLKNIGTGAKNPMNAEGGSQKFGSFLRYFLDEDARKIATKKQMGDDDTIDSEVGGLPLSSISKKVGDYTAKYGSDNDDFGFLRDKKEEKEETPKEGGNKIVEFFQKMLSEQSSKTKDKVKVIDSDGNLSWLPKEQLELAQKQGYKLAS